MREEDHALTAEAACEEDEDGTGLEGCARFGGVDGFADLRRGRGLDGVGKGV